jgi:hypothetical protein
MVERIDFQNYSSLFFHFRLPEERFGDDRRQSLYEVTPMKDQNRDTRASAVSDRDGNNFCFGRVLANFALVNVENTTNLRTAKARIRRLAARIPGAYLVFNRRTHQVLEKIVSHARV